MSITWGDYSSSRSIEITPADVQVSSITAPIEDSIHSSSITITYQLVSYQSPEDPALVFYVEFEKEGYGIDGQTWILADIQVQYSKDGGTSWSTCSEDTLSYSGISEGTENLLTSLTGEIHNYVWAMLTNMGTNDYLTNAYIRIKAYDGASWSSYLNSSAFTIDTVPVAPTYNDESFSDGYRTKDTTPEFNFDIPTDVGSDRLHFKIDMDTTEDFNSSSLVSRNSYDNDGFWHYHNNVDPSGSYTINNYKKYGDWYFQITGVTTGGIYSFGDYKDFYKDIYLPAEFIDPKVIFYSDSNIFYYLSSISITGITVSMTSDSTFTDYTALTGGTSTATLTCHLFEGAWGEYWISDVVVSGTTKSITYGSGDFTTDDNGTTIPAIISTGTSITFQSNSDSVFWLTSITSSGFTINKASDMGSPGVTDSVNIFVIKTKTNVYFNSNQGGLPSNSFKYNIGGLDSNGESVPEYIPGIHCLASARNQWVPVMYNARMQQDMSDTGLKILHIGGHPTEPLFYNADLTFYGGNADYFWVPIGTYGIPEEYENERAKYTVQTADALTSGDTYYYRLAAGNTD